MSAATVPKAPTALQAQLIGAPAFSWQNQPLRVPPRLAGLLAYLALEGPTAREVLQETFWPEGTSQHVRQALYSLRSLPGADCWLQDAASVVGVQAATDLTGMLALLDQENVPLAALRRWPTGGLLASLRTDRPGPFEEWLAHERTRLVTRQASAFGRWGARALQDGQADVALDVARTWVTADPLDERACQLLMRAHAAAGHPGAIQDAVGALRLALRQALDADPSEETLALLQELSAQGGVRHGRAVLLTRDRPGPWTLEPLHGRGAERKRLTALLDTSGRVGLYGLAGIGKTRLAAAAAQDALERQGGQVLWFSAGDDRPRAALETLCVALHVRTPDALVDALIRHEVTLCVLDDVWTAETLQALLGELPPTLPVIVTSRARWEGLRALNVDRLPRRDARKLLCTHAPELSPDDIEVDALCALLGDHPYALRLAGRTLQAGGILPGDLLRSLQGAPHTLGGGQIDALLRQSTRSLGGAEYEVFLGLGSLPVSAATPELLALALRRSPGEVEEALYGLVRRGLCTREAQPGAELVHYRMHDLTWSAARAHEALLPTTVTAAVLTYARSAADDPTRLDAERPTLLEVLRWARRDGDEDTLIDLLGAWLGGPYLAARGFPRGHLELLHAGTEAAARTGRWAAAATLHGKLADIQQGLLGDGVAAAQLYQQAAGYAAQAGLKERQATFLGLEATQRALHHLPDVQPTLERALDCARESGDPVCLARILEQRGLTRAMGGDFTAARDSFVQARDALAPLLSDHPQQLAAQRAYLNATGNLAQAEQRLGHLAEATRYREEALKLALQRNEHLRIANARADLGEVYRLQGRLAEARDQLGQAIDLYRTLGATGPEAAARTLLHTLPPT